MKNAICVCLVFLLTVAGVMPATAQPKLSPDNIDEVVAAMTLEEKAHLVNGIGTFWGGSNSCRSTRDIPGAPGGTFAIPRLGIPSLYFGDGPLGLRIDEKREYDNHHYCTTAEPVPLLLGSSWDPEVIRSVAEDIAEECRDYGVDVMLGPSENILRNPLCGRTHEYYSEDPLLSGIMAGAFIEGVQSVGIGASLKHFAVNNQETNRSAVNAIVSQRALREIYLRPFEVAINHCEPWTVMTSYNGLNGYWTSESRELLDDVLRGDWGYSGMVMTDWGGGTHPVRQMQAGNDLLEPGGTGEDIMQAVRDGVLSEQQLDQNVKRILQLIVRTFSYSNYTFSNRPDLKSHQAMARRVAAESAILLKNEQQTLPLTPEVKHIALFGRTAYNAVPGGIGWNESSSGNYHISFVEGLRNAGYEVPFSLLRYYAPKTPMWGQPAPEPVTDELKVEPEFLSEQVANTDVAIIVLGHAAGEGTDRVRSAFYMTEAEKTLIREVTDAYHQVGKKAIVILNIPGPVEVESWRDLPDAILCIYQGGEQMGNWVADVLRGEVTPSGKLTTTFARDIDDYPSSRNFPVLDKAFEMRGMMAEGQGMTRHDQMVNEGTKDIDYCRYEEGIYVGYRYFDTFNVPVSYTFGYGLSYTTFKYSNATINKQGENIQVTVDVTNTGNYKGREVVQLYVTAPKGRLDKPARELKAFAKTRTLAPGETQTLIMTVTPKQLASFDTAHSQWITDGGKYTFQVSASLTEVQATLHASLKRWTQKVRDVLKPQTEINDLRP